MVTLVSRCRYICKSFDWAMVNIPDSLLLMYKIERQKTRKDMTVKGYISLKCAANQNTSTQHNI